MKSLLLVTALAFLSVTAIAQVRLTQADYEKFFNAESVENYTAVNITNATMDVGTAGTGNTYDLNAFTWQLDQSDCNFVDPSMTPFAERFPNATHAYCQKMKNSVTLTFYTLTDEALYLEGNARIVDGMPFVYSSGLHRPVLDFPAQFGTGWDYIGEVEQQTPGNSVQTITHYDIDANGTMFIGFESQPCMRMKVVDETIHENNLGGIISRSVQRSISYVFMTNQGLTVTAIIDSLDENLANARITSLSYTVYKAGPVSVGDLDHAATIHLSQNYPNPVNATTGYTANVSWSVSGQNFVQLALYDITGKERMRLYDGIAAPGTHTASMDASSLSPGTYFLRLRNGAEVQTRLVSVVK